ncbi:MAG: ABC transporter ATP-binding protein [Candidatus Shapirobacteria bacterium]|jgi:ATP-binding cassette subfamily B protein
MMRLMRYLKPYVASIVLIVVLLFLQANADLALPDYMSRIVNTGIQQGGIEDSLPQAMGGTKFDMVLMFTSPEEGAAILAAYDRFEPGSEAHQALLKKYPNADSEPLYILKKVDAMTRSRLNVLMVGAISSRLTDIDPSIVTQMGIQAVKGEYERLGMDTVALQTSYILSIGGLMLLLTLLSVVATVIVGFLGARTAAGFARDLRVNLFRKVENFSFAELDKFSTASLITRSTNDITQMQMVTVMGLRMFFYAPIIGIGGVIRATGKASSMWWIIALAVSIILGIIAVVFAIALPKFKSIQKFIDKLNLVVRENLSGMMVIRAFAMQGEEEKRFDKANRDLGGTMLFVTRVMVVLMPLMMLIMNLVSLLIVWTGAKEVALSQIRVGDMMAFMQYAMQIFFAFIMLSMMFIILPRASVSADRIAEVLATEPSIVDPESPRAIGADFSGTIEFEDVSFRYPGATENVLSNISFTAKPGQTTAIIGTTGSGKSTLVSLIPRFYDATEGSIRVGGIDIRAVSQEALRSKIGFVPQKASLFSGTVESNLLYADENASKEDMALALEISQAKEFVDAKPEGIGLEISQGGGNVSGGQRQRLTIARAIVRKAPIYIFDDSFSALDFRTDTLLRQALKASLSQSTILLVTQRVAAIKQADQILVLDEGRLVGQGTHHELMETCEVYRDIAMSQLKQEELA